MSDKSFNNKNHHLDLLSIARATMIEQGFEPDMPADAELELKEIDENALLSKSTARDLRGLLWSSIDNLTSRDLDQVEYVEKLSDGNIRVLVGIADVAAFVPKGSAIDIHAAENTTSVYTGIVTFPMLPEELSTDKTSLLEGHDRLAVVIEYLVTPSGSTQTSDVYPALVHNYSKMSYEVVGKWLDGADNSPAPEEVTHVENLEEQVRLQFETAKRLRDARRKLGALRLETIEATPVIDEHGEITDLSVTEQNSARDIIESFMVAANSSMAEFLDQREIASLRRVVTTPANWPRIVEIANDLHETLPAEPNVRALSDFLERQRKADPDHFPDLSLAVVKLLGPGDYVVQIPGRESPGHFGLAVHRYTHSTAPNRRYADLITQRLLKNSTYSAEELQTIADRCNDRESAARKVERKMRKVAAAVLMKHKIGEEFDAIVTGVSQKGTFARIVRPPVDGMIVKGEHGLKVGQHTRVRLLSVDPVRGFIDFAAV
ncbi:MAG TPA: RNB domain-containing ribonuclease [Pyrinomonadaceae bacterium]